MAEVNDAPCAKTTPKMCFVFLSSDMLLGLFSSILLSSRKFLLFHGRDTFPRMVHEAALQNQTEFFNTTTWNDGKGIHFVTFEHSSARFL